MQFVSRETRELLHGVRMRTSVVCRVNCAVFRSLGVCGNTPDIWGSPRPHHPSPLFCSAPFSVDPVCHHWPLDWLLFLLLPVLLLQLLLWTLPAQVIGARRGLLRVPRGPRGADQDRHGKRWSKRRAEVVGVPA